MAGHYGCGGVKAALTKNNFGTLEAWLFKLRKIRHNHASDFEGLNTIDEKVSKLVEINVYEQMLNLASTPFVQKAWKEGQTLRINGVVFDLATGLLNKIHADMHSLEQVPEELALFEL